MGGQWEPISGGSNNGDFGERLAPGERSTAAYACDGRLSRGRRYEEPLCPTRSPFQRDRDRVIHSTAFRRLTHKTQVFLFHEGDHYRTRLTHSLEVAQIARTIARQLRLDEDLAEALALAHDLGHPPFGHAGERALDQVMHSYGGFDHNAQSFRVVTQLEHRYLEFDGLNLTWEALEGLAKHNGPVAAQSPVAKVARSCETWSGLGLDLWASAEAQAAAIADDVAYVNHDIDDGLRAGLISFDDLAGAALVGTFAREVGRGAADADSGRRTYAVTRRMITALIADAVAESRVRLRRMNPASPDDIRHAGAATIAFSPQTERSLLTLKAFLYERVYRHPRVMGVMVQAEGIVQDLFSRYFADEAALPETWRRDAAGLSERPRARVMADFVAGMTDRYAIAEHRRLFDATPELR